MTGKHKIILSVLLKEEYIMNLYKPGRPKEFDTLNNTDYTQVPASKGEYRIIGKDRKVKYVGYSNDLRRRMREHMRSGKLSGDNSIFAYKVADGRASRDCLALHEASKIKKHDPVLNKRAGGAGRPFRRKNKE
jgi:hypothetical protein